MLKESAVFIYLNIALNVIANNLVLPEKIGFCKFVFHNIHNNFISNLNM